MNSLSGYRILVVEDEVLVAWALDDMLVALGYRVVGPAARVDQALSMVDGESVDAAILDVNLNGQKSYPVADALAAQGIPFVFSTGYHKDSIADGYQDFPMLQKPYEQSELANMLSALLVLDGPISNETQD